MSDYPTWAFGADDVILSQEKAIERKQANREAGYTDQVPDIEIEADSILSEVAIARYLGIDESPAWTIRPGGLKTKDGRPYDLILPNDVTIECKYSSIKQAQYLALPKDRRPEADTYTFCRLSGKGPGWIRYELIGCIDGWTLSQEGEWRVLSQESGDYQWCMHIDRLAPLSRLKTYVGRIQAEEPIAR